MLEMIFAAALMDTVIAVPAEGTVYVHEWGVVTFTEESVLLGGDPDMVIPDQFFPTDQQGDMVVRAPVVYFYGAPFSGSFTVDAGSGSFLETYPVPSVESLPPASGYAEYASSTWRITGTSQEEERMTEPEYGSVSCIGPELMELWRKPPSMVLEFVDGSVEKYIYYECSLDPGTGDGWDPVLTDGPEIRLDPEYQGELLVFVKEEGGVELTGGTGDDMIPMLCDWAGGSMKTQELEALWQTWEGWIYDGSWQGDTLFVFPLPGTTVDNITRIRLITDEWMDVEYSRFFLGMFSS